MVLAGTGKAGKTKEEGVCATPATWNEGGCHQVLGLPRKVPQATNPGPRAPPSTISATPATWEMVCGRRREAEEKEEPGIQNQKQEPHTKMWGKKHVKLGSGISSGMRGFCFIQGILLARLFRRNVEHQIGFCIRRSLEGLLFFFLISDKKIPAEEQKLRCCASIRFKLLVEQRFYSLYQHIPTYINITQQYTVMYFYVLST